MNAVTAIRPVRRSRARRVARCTLVGLFIAVLVGCTVQSTPTTIKNPVPQEQPVPTLQDVGYCSDGTMSSDPSYALHIRQLVAEAIAAWAPVPPSSTASGAPSRPGLRFVARSVTATSNTTDRSDAPANVDGVPALATEPRPDDKRPADKTYADQIRAWTTQRTAYLSAATKAHEQAVKLAKAMATFRIVRHTTSGIYNCLGALADQLRQGTGTHARLVVASDMQDNRPLVSLDLAGDAVMMITICPTNKASTCPARFAAATRFLRRHGASSVIPIRADAVGTTDLIAFWRAAS